MEPEPYNFRHVVTVDKNFGCNVYLFALHYFLLLGAFDHNKFRNKMKVEAIDLFVESGKIFHLAIKRVYLCARICVTVVDKTSSKYTFCVCRKW